MSKTLTEGDLAQFTGSECVYRHWAGLRYTEGVKHVAEAGGAYWLIDAIASYQLDQRLRKLRWWSEFQLWTLHVAQHGDGPSAPPPLADVDISTAYRNGCRVAVLTCRPDSDRSPTVIEGIPYTDFPILGDTKLYVEGGVLLLPSEH